MTLDCLTLNLCSGSQAPAWEPDLGSSGFRCHCKPDGPVGRVFLSIGGQIAKLAGRGTASRGLGTSWKVRFLIEYDGGMMRYLIIFIAISTFSHLMFISNVSFADTTDRKLRLGIQANGEKSTTELKLTENDTPFISAKVSVRSGSSVFASAIGGSSISGWFYNDSRGPGSGQDYNGQEGEVWLDVRRALYDDNTLRAEVFAERADSADGNLYSTTYEQQFSKSVLFDTEYTLSIELTDSAAIFKCDDEVLRSRCQLLFTRPIIKSGDLCQGFMPSQENTDPWYPSLMMFILTNREFPMTILTTSSLTQQNGIQASVLLRSNGQLCRDAT